MAAKSNERLARVYAEALMANAVKSNAVDSIAGELDDLTSGVFENASAAAYISTPVVSWRTSASTRSAE